MLSEKEGQKLGIRLRENFSAVFVINQEAVKRMSPNGQMHAAEKAFVKL